MRRIEWLLTRNINSCPSNLSKVKIKNTKFTSIHGSKNAVRSSQTLKSNRIKQTVTHINDSTRKEIYSDFTASGLYACPFVFETDESSKNQQSLNFTSPIKYFKNWLLVDQKFSQSISYNLIYKDLNCVVWT